MIRCLLQESGDFTWRVSDCEELVGVTLRRFGGRLWKIVKRNNRSGSYIFNGCSVHLGYFFNDGWKSSKLTKCNAPLCSTSKNNVEPASV